MKPVSPFQQLNTDALSLLANLIKTNWLRYLKRSAAPWANRWRFVSIRDVNTFPRAEIQHDIVPRVGSLSLTVWIHVDRHMWWARRFLQSQNFLSGSLAWSSSSLHMKHSGISEEEEEGEKVESFIILLTHPQSVHQISKDQTVVVNVCVNNGLWIYLRLYRKLYSSFLRHLTCVYSLWQRHKLILSFKSNDAGWYLWRRSEWQTRIQFLSRDRPLIAPFLLLVILPFYFLNHKIITKVSFCRHHLDFVQK